MPADARSPAVSKASKVVELSKVVVRAAPSIVTAELGTKPTPVNVIVVAAPPAFAPVGLSDVRLGVWFFTASGKLLEEPPFGGGFTTAICNVPEVARSAAAMDVCNEVEPTKVVETLFPLTVIVDCETKFLPVTVNVKPTPPVKAPAGESEVICGTELALAVMVKGSARVTPPPGCGVDTCTCATPPFWISVAGIETLSVVELTKIVDGRAGLLGDVRVWPFHSMVDEGVNDFPVTVSVKVGCPA